MLDQYYIYVKRINGASLSLNDFWAMDWWQFQYIYDKEMELIKEEEKEYKKQELQSTSTSSSGRMIPNKVDDSQEGIDAYNSLFVDDDNADN